MSGVERIICSRHLVVRRTTSLSLSLGFLIVSSLGCSTGALCVRDVVETPHSVLVSLRNDNGDHAGAIRSRDLGQTWSPVRIDSIGNIALGVTQCDTILFAECSDKSWQRSTDYGQTWRPLKPSLADLTSPIVRARSGVLYAGSWHGPFCSTDNGATWLELGGNGLTHKWVVSVTSTTSAVFVMGITRQWTIMDHYTSGYGLFRSIDGGTSWTDISSRMPEIVDWGTWGGDVVTIGNVLFFSVGRSLLESVDDGDHWKHLTVPQIDTAWIFVALRKVDSILVGVAMNGHAWRLLTSIDLGRTWATEEFIPPTPEWPLEYVIRNSLFAVFCEYDRGHLWRSSDKGKTWQVIPFGKP
jgi:hypothetical protein